LSGPADLPAEKGPEADPARVAGWLRSFVDQHGGGGTAVISYLGRPGARIVVVSADGVFADAVVRDLSQAAAVCAAAGIPVGTWDRELSSRITVTAADRDRMAGTGR